MQRRVQGYLVPFLFPMLKSLLQGATLAVALTGVSGCASGPVTPPTTPEQRAEELEGVRQLPELTRSFRIRIGQLLGLEEALKTRASELASSNPDQARALLEQAAILRRQIDASAAGVPQMLQAHAAASHRTHREVLVNLRAAGIQVFDTPESVRPLIERLISESRQRGQEIATLRREIENLRNGNFQQEISQREEKIAQLEAQQRQIDGAYLDANWGEEERSFAHWDQISELLIEIDSAYQSGLGVSPVAPAIPAPPQK